MYKEGVEFSRVFVWNPEFSNFPSVVPILLNRCLLFCAFYVLSKVRAMRVWNEYNIPHKDNNANPIGAASLRQMRLNDMESNFVIDINISIWILGDL